MKGSTKTICTAVLIASLIVPTVFAQRGGHASATSHAMGNRGMSSTHQPGSPKSGHSAGPAMRLSGKSASDLLQQNTKLAGKLENILQVPGTTDAEKLAALQADAAGFKNLGQFVAAVHVSQNLGIPFDQLKSKMTGDGAVSLGKSISELKPDAAAKTEAKKASTQAESDLSDSQPRS